MDANKEWMKDPALAGIDKAKLSFLEKLFVQSASIDMTNQKEMLPFLLSLSKLSKENNISFVLQKYSSKEDISKMEKLSSAFHFR